MLLATNVEQSFRTCNYDTAIFITYKVTNSNGLSKNAKVVRLPPIIVVNSTAELGGPSPPQLRADNVRL